MTSLPPLPTTTDAARRARFVLVVLLPYGPLHPRLKPRLVHTSRTRVELEALRDQLQSLHSTGAIQFRGVDAHYQPVVVPPAAALLQILDVDRARLLFHDWQKAYGELVQREDAAPSPTP